MIDFKFSPYGSEFNTDPFLNTADPATSMFAPALAERGAVSVVIPPSTSR